MGNRGQDTPDLMARSTLVTFFRLALAASALVGSAAHAYEFVPTTPEFSSWPRHCQARYVTTDIGRQQLWAAGYPQAVVQQTIAEIGWDTFEKLHHYCAGLIWLSRAKLEPDIAQRKFYLRTARAEVLFTYQAMNKQHPIATNVMVALAQVCEMSGDYDCTVDTLEQAIDLHRDAAMPYIALSIAYRDQKMLDKAKDALLRGDEATEGKSPEINYNLGLLLVDLKDYDGAVERAKRAYELGYPLPGLKNKLVRLRRWPEAQ